MTTAHPRTRHAPSPWRAEPGHGGSLNIRDANGVRVCRIETEPSAVSPGKARGNAALIEAAPALLSGLQFAIARMGDAHAAVVLQKIVDRVTGETP